MRRVGLFSGIVAGALVLASPALAGWGEDWGTMVWGSVAAVPTMGKLGFLVLALGLGGVAARAIKRSRSAASLLVVGLVLPMLSPAANAQTVLVPNTFTNGSVADADAMNDNFDSVLKGVNAALTTGPVSVPNTFTNGTTADADEVNANFTALETGVNTALTNRATDCATLGGTWDTGTSTCTPGPPASDYNCFVGGFCSRVVLWLPNTTWGYPNVYEGHTQGVGDALAAGCNEHPGNTHWGNGWLWVGPFYAQSPFISCPYCPTQFVYQICEN